jgi:hypothetical protein
MAHTKTHHSELNSVVPEELYRGLDAYLDAVDEVAPGRLVGLYGVGSLALGDFSAEHSNLDLVSVTDTALAPEQLRRLTPSHHKLQHGHRPARVCYLTWADLRVAPLDGLPVSYLGRARERGEGLATPMTWAILHDRALALRGPSHPVVHSDPDARRAWFHRSLQELSRRPGTLLWRPAVGARVLEAARLAQGAATGEVVSKTTAGKAALELVSSRHRRVLRDVLGFRHGAHTSMYWGPLERSKDAKGVIRSLLELAEAGGLTG